MGIERDVFDFFYYRSFSTEGGGFPGKRKKERNVMKSNNQMVKNIRPIRTLKYERQNRIVMGHMLTVQYIAMVSI